VQFGHKNNNKKVKTSIDKKTLQETQTANNFCWQVHQPTTIQAQLLAAVGEEVGPRHQLEPLLAAVAAKSQGEKTD